MAGQDELFQLIKSLSASEKRYFKTNAKKAGDTLSNYMQLFDAVDSQGDEYDEAGLKKKHAKKSFVKYLSAEKKYLREQIMKQLRAFYADSTIDNTINQLLSDARIFRDKGLVSLCHKALTKAKVVATKYERYYLLNETLVLLAEFVVEFEKKKLTEPVIQLINEQKQLAVIQESKLELLTKNRELFSLYRSGADMSNQQIRNRADMLITEVEQYRMHLGQSFTLGALFNRAYSSYSDMVRHSEESLQYTIEEYNLFHKHNHFISENPNYYKICLANLISRAMSANNDEWFKRAVAEMKQLPTNTFNEEGEVFQNIYFSEHLFYINRGDFGKAEALVPIIEKGLITYASKINQARKLAFQFNIMIMYFIMHDFKQALQWTMPLLDDTSEIKQHQKFVTFLLLPFIHFELGHAELVDSFARSAYRLLKRNTRLHAFERLVLKYLKNMPLSKESPDFKPMVTEFHEELEKLMNDASIPTILGMEELSLWAKSHFSGEKMTTLLSKNSESKN